MPAEPTEKKSIFTLPRTRAAASAAYRRFLAIRGEPREIASGLALGVFIGFSPTMGLQLAMALFLAALFRINKIAAGIGVFITNPFTAPFIYYLTYLAGSVFYHPGTGGDPSAEMAAGTLLKLLEKTPGIFFTLVIGGVVLGLPLALITYYTSLSAILKYRVKVKEKLAKERELLARAKESLATKVGSRKRRKKKKKARNR